jgi:EAL domain-containing protein (putative c-di-GMP-specific phosphodiesterase class I)
MTSKTTNKFSPEVRERAVRVVLGCPFQIGMVIIAIDDFGTGYSSLSYLKNLPLDVLKIDRSFITGLGHDSEDDAIVQAIISLARSLNLKVTGEGIETREQTTLLSGWGCNLGQGYYYAKPQDEAGTTNLLRAAEHHSLPANAA